MTQQYSLAAERALLGALLFDSALFDDVSRILTASAFFDPVHALAFETMNVLQRSNAAINPILVDAGMRQSAGYVEAGGMSWLQALLKETPSIAGARDFARLIKDLSVRREIAYAARDIIDRVEASSIEDDSDRLLVEAETTIASVGAEQMRRLETAADAVGRWLDRLNDEAAAGVRCGLADLDEMLGGFSPEGLYILAARPSMGKTSAGLALAKGIARASGGGVLVCSLEMDSAGLVSRLVSDLMREDGVRLAYASIEKKLIGESERPAFERAAAAAFDLPLMFDTMENATAGRVRQSARQAQRRFETQGRALAAVVVDYIGLMGSDSRSTNRVEIEGEKALALKTLAREIRAPVIALCQLSREVEKRDDRRPQLSDLRWSGDIEAHADAVMLLYRPAYYVKKAEPPYGADDWIDWQAEFKAVERQLFWHVDKNRQGPTGSVETACEIETSAIRDKGFAWFAR